MIFRLSLATRTTISGERTMGPRSLIWMFPVPCIVKSTHIAIRHTHDHFQFMSKDGAMRNEKRRELFMVWMYLLSSFSPSSSLVESSPDRSYTKRIFTTLSYLTESCSVCGTHWQYYVCKPLTSKKNIWKAAIFRKLSIILFLLIAKAPGEQLMTSVHVTRHLKHVKSRKKNSSSDVNFFFLFFLFTRYLNIN